MQAATDDSTRAPRRRKPPAQVDDPMRRDARRHPSPRPTHRSRGDLPRALVPTLRPRPHAPRPLPRRPPDRRPLALDIPGMHGNEGAAEDWLRIKKTVLVLG